MKEARMYRTTGWFGIGTVVLWLSQFPLYMQGNSAVSVYDGAGMAQNLFRIRNIVFSRLLLDLGLYAAMMVFAARLSHLVRRAGPDYSWVATLVFGAAAVWLGVSLVANGLEGGAALDTLGGNADPSVVRSLTMGYLLIYNSSIAFGITGLFLGAVGYATFATGILPRWTGWLAYTGVALCLASIPALFGGPVDPTGFYNPGGWGPAIMANFPPAIWFLAVSIILIRKGRNYHIAKARPEQDNKTKPHQ